jgi:hypothetical protein
MRVIITPASITIINKNGIIGVTLTRSKPPRIAAGAESRLKEA